jgi:hypothetical protein
VDGSLRNFGNAANRTADKNVLSQHRRVSVESKTQFQICRTRLLNSLSIETFLPLLALTSSNFVIRKKL